MTLATLIFFILLFLIFFSFVRFLKELFSKPKRKFKRKKSKRKKVALSSRDKAKAERKYTKLLNEFRRKHRRKPSKDDLFGIVITASHHVFPVRGKNVRRWTKGKRGHWNRQRVRKYLLEKNNIVKNYIMR